MAIVLRRSRVHAHPLVAALLVAFVLALGALAAVPPCASAASRIVWSARPAVSAPDDGLVQCARGPDGSVYAAGTRGSQATMKIWVVRYRANGKRMWSESWTPAPGEAAQFSRLAVDGAGNAYVTGIAYTATGSYTAVLKYDRSGRLRWPRVLDDRFNVGGPIALDRSGGVYVGTTAEVVADTRTCRIVKLATGDGSTVWTEEWGGAYACVPVDLVVTRAGVCHVAAYVGAGLDEPSSGWLLRVSSGGKVDASREWDPGGEVSLDWTGIERLPSGDLVLLGSVGVDGNRDLALVRATPDCEEVWLCTWTSSGTAEDWPRDLDVDARGGIWAVVSRDPGAAGDDGRTSVVRWTPAGKRVFARRVASGRYGTWLEGVTTDSRGNGFVVGARTLSGSRTDFIAARYSRYGRLVWRLQGLRGVAYDRLAGVCLAEPGRLFACGQAGSRGLLLKLRR